MSERNYWYKMSNEQLLNYIRKNHQGETFTEIGKGKDKRAYLQVRERGLIDDLVKDGTLLKCHKDDGYWKDSAHVNEAYNKLRIRLGKRPTSQEFTQEYGGAIDSIKNGDYHPKIHSWNDFLIYQGEKGIEPSKKMVNKRERIDWNKISDEDLFKHIKENYNGEILNKFGKGESHRVWSQAKKRGILDRLISEGIIFRQQNSSGYWSNPANINDAFNKLREKFGRSPTSVEIGEKYGTGLINAIYDGRYSDTIKNWKEYVIFMEGTVRNDWSNPSNIDEAFDQLKSELGRVPKYDEIIDRYGGIMNAISKGKYLPEIKTYNQYLIHRGEKVKTNSEKIKTPQDLKTLCDTDPKAKYLVELCRGNDIDVADIIAIVYEGKIARDDAIKILQEPSIREYLGGFRKPLGIPEIQEYANILLPLDKNDIIRNIIYKRLVEDRRNQLGLKPSEEQISEFKQKVQKNLEALV